MRAILSANVCLPGPGCHSVLLSFSGLYLKESPEFQVSLRSETPCLVWSRELPLRGSCPRAQPVKHSVCLCLCGGAHPLGLNRWGQIMFSPFSVINSNHPSVAGPGAANTSKSGPRRNFSSLLNLNLSTCLSVKTEQREEK